jgi:TetR/AcrR family transcriptional regulator, transcriptional repressor for nem operon
MARPKEFDREVALKIAMEVFWAKGYEATSTDDLRHAIGIGRQSLYDTFASKRGLYLEALRRYQDESVSARIRSLRSAGSPLAGITNLLVDVARETPAQRALGCMGVNAICEFGAADADVSAIGQESERVLLSALEQTLKDAKAKGEIRASVDERAAAQFLHMTLVGLKITAKAGAKPEVLRRIAGVAVDGLGPG